MRGGGLTGEAGIQIPGRGHKSSNAPPPKRNPASSLEFHSWEGSPLKTCVRCPESGNYHKQSIAWVGPN